MPAEWKLSPGRRRSQPRAVGPEPHAERIDSRGDERAMSPRVAFEKTRGRGRPTFRRRSRHGSARRRSETPSVMASTLSPDGVDAVHADASRRRG